MTWRLMAHRVHDPVIRESAPLRYPFAADDAATAFGNERAARVRLEGARWPDGPRCPKCASPSRRGESDPDGRYWCGSCRRRFNVCTGTALQRRRAPLRAWAVGVALSTNGPFVVRPEALRETCGITAGAARDVADGLRAACGGIVCPGRLPADLWHMFWSGPDPADIRLPRDALLVANRLLNGRFLDPDAKRWALRHLPLDALRAQTAYPAAAPTWRGRCKNSPRRTVADIDAWEEVLDARLRAAWPKAGRIASRTGGVLTGGTAIAIHLRCGIAAARTSTS